MKCPTRGLKWHLRRWCPQNRTGKGGKGGKGKGQSSGGPGVLFANQSQGGLSEVPVMPLQI
eukprot:3005093-Prorocentrum_lima.AAC.1